MHLKMNHRSNVKQSDSGKIKRNWAIIANGVQFIYFCYLTIFPFSLEIILMGKFLEISHRSGT
jgi:hypothetical protein